MVLENNSYTKKYNSIKVGYGIEDLKMVNYVVVHNNNGEIYYYFVTDKTVIGEKVTQLVLKLDVMQTYMFDFELQESLIEREHKDRWYVNQGKRLPFTSQIEEGLEVGEYVLQTVNTIYDYTDKGTYFITSSDMVGISDDKRSGKDDGEEGGGNGELPDPTKWIMKNEYLTMEEKKHNAKLFRDFFIAKGWTIESICGMLGNIETESNINPALWESMDNGNMDGGYGLVQWTPASKYFAWLTGEDTGNKQCERIVYEKDNGIQWYSTPDYPMTFDEFSKSVQPVEYLAEVFINNYERPFDANQPIRGEQAKFWLNYLTGGE